MKKLSCLQAIFSKRVLSFVLLHLGTGALSSCTAVFNKDGFGDGGDKNSDNPSDQNPDPSFFIVAQHQKISLANTTDYTIIGGTPPYAVSTTRGYLSNTSVSQ